MFAIWLSHCLAHADEPTNNATNKIIKGSGYSVMRGTNGQLFYSNPDEFWYGVLKEDTNGWRVLLRVDLEPGYRVPGKRVSTNLTLRVQWGSTVRNSGEGYYRTPNGKFAKFELSNSKGEIIPPNPDAGTNLLIKIYNWYERSAPTISLAPGQSPPWVRYETNLPAWVSPTKGSLTASFPKTITAEVYPRQEFTGMIGKIECFTNWPPPYLGYLNLDTIYSITNEGDYTLAVQPVLYKKRMGTNILDRVDLPCVTTKVHIGPSSR